jgi:hypothetical protein
MRIADWAGANLTVISSESADNLVHVLVHV